MTVVNLRLADPPSNQDGLWPTVTKQCLQACIENSRQTGQLALVAGPSGIGKTTAARAAVKAARRAALDSDDVNEPTIVYVPMTRAAQGLQPGLLRLAAAVNLSVSQYSGAHDVHDALVQHRWVRGSLIVLDEAQFMSDDLLHGVRSLWDELDLRRTPVGIILVGTLDLAARIKGHGRKAVAFEAFRGRLGVNLELGALEAGDPAAICRHHGIRDAKSEAVIRRAAGLSGGLHNVKRMLAQATQAAGEGNVPTLANLLQAAELAGLAS